MIPVCLEIVSICSVLFSTFYFTFCFKYFVSEYCVHMYLPKAGLHRLELNPYWKDGGTGLPPEEKNETAAAKGELT